MAKKRKPEPPTEQRGRPRKPDALSDVIFTRVTKENGERLRQMAKDFRVELADLLRWMVEDAVEGAWMPSHLKHLKQL